MPALPGPEQQHAGNTGNSAASQLPGYWPCRRALKPLVLGWGLEWGPSTSACSVEVCSGQTPGGSVA